MNTVSAFVTSAKIPTSSTSAAARNNRRLRPTATRQNSSNGPDTDDDTDESSSSSSGTFNPLRLGEDEETTTSSSTGTINPLRLAVLKLGLTELRYTSPLNYEKRPGSYTCAGCGCDLFTSAGKYDSGSGWPSFWKTSNDVREESGGVLMKREFDGRVECSCSTCGGHLGHVFPDGPKRKEVPEGELLSVPETDLQTSSPDNQYSRLPRYCINGASLKFTEDD